MESNRSANSLTRKEMLGTAGSLASFLSGSWTFAQKFFWPNPYFMATFRAG